MPPHSIGTGTISFGLVSIPIRLYPDTSPAGVSFNMLHAKCGSRLRQQMFCPVDNEVVDRSQTVRGYEVAKDQYVRVADEELKALEGEASKIIDIAEFVPLAEVDPIYFEKTYYLGPDKGGEKPYRLLADAIGSPRPRIDEVLEVTHLGDRGRDRYAGYSLGMKQRLAIAATLLKDPELLIFDEPTNGLDPAGIREVRDTMRTLGEAGKTVLVSSHILTELAEMCDTVAIIEQGRLLAVGTVDEIRRARQMQRAVEVRVLADAEGLCRWLRERGHTANVHREGDRVEFLHDGDQQSEADRRQKGDFRVFADDDARLIDDFAEILALEFLETAPDVLPGVLSGGAEAFPLFLGLFGRVAQLFLRRIDGVLRPIR